MSTRYRPAKGLLVEAVEAGLHMGPTWVPVDVGDGLTITVSADALAAPIPDAERPLRLPVSYAETIVLCRMFGCIPPTVPFSDAIWAAAAARVTPVPLVRTAVDATLMSTVAFTIAHNDHIEATPYDPGDLLADVGKDWVLDSGIAARGAVNYGWRLVDPSGNPRPIQPIGRRHDATHYDYSQVLRLVKREATLDGEPIDLLDHLAASIDERFLAPYR